MGEEKSKVKAPQVCLNANMFKNRLVFYATFKHRSVTSFSLKFGFKLSTETQKNSRSVTTQTSLRFSLLYDDRKQPQVFSHSHKGGKVEEKRKGNQEQEQARGEGRGFGTEPAAIGGGGCPSVGHSWSL